MVAGDDRFLTARQDERRHGMKEGHVNEKVKVMVLGTTARASYSAGEANKIRKAVMDRLILASMEPYLKVYAVVKYGRDGKPCAIVAYMLRAYTYTADVARLSIDARYGVKSVDTSHVEEDDTEFAIAQDKLPRSMSSRTVDMVFGTPVPEIPTAKAGVEEAYRVATLAGYRCVKLLGRAANLANYRRYLSGHLKAFGNIGHGYAGGIILANGVLTSKWFRGLTSGLASGLPGRALCPEVVYFNSCQTFNRPLQPAIMSAGARTFIGGKVSLLIGSSEDVFKCFWTSVLKARKLMRQALRDCEMVKYPVVGAHGLSGDSGKFQPIPQCW
jgi:hypothetical protein